MEQKAWLVAVDMGYGHQRTAYPLKRLAGGKVINANNYEGIPEKDRKIWQSSRLFYEFISNLKKIPLIGNLIFYIFDAFQKILSFYPKKDLSRPTLVLKEVYSLFKKGWGRDLVEELGKNPLPLISTFYTAAFMAEFFNYPGEIFCVICDADISRTWAPLKPESSRIKYFTPTERVKERLKLYGIKPENIYLTGYPLPLGNIGSENPEILKEDFKARLLNLDPKKKYFDKYKILVESNLGRLPEKSGRPLTILFSVGGAGAQKEMGIKIVRSLADKIKAGEVKVILSAGIRRKVKEYFEKKLGKIRENVEILYREKIEDYFGEFNQKLRETDILWTKPSELSFYAALGIPIIIAPPIGSQEDFNMRWLLKSGFGILQGDPNYTSQWLFDWLGEGYLAEAAMQGFIEGEKLGTLNIEKICCG